MPENTSLNKRTVAASAAGVVLGFLIGFFLANGINRAEQEKLRAELAARRANAGAGGGADAGAQRPGQQAEASGDDAFPTLTDEQLANAVARADAEPANVEMQRKVGQALYVYAWQRNNASILPDVARILRRAHELDPTDHKTTVMAGDAQFLIARSSGEAGALDAARKLYEKALAAKPEDAVVRTSLGLTYFYGRPSDPQRAIREYRRALQADPRQEMSVQSLAAALIETGSLEEAGRRLDELEKLNSSNPELANLRAQLEQKRNAEKERQ